MTTLYKYIQGLPLPRHESTVTVNVDRLRDFVRKEFPDGIPELNSIRPTEKTRPSP